MNTPRNEPAHRAQLALVAAFTGLVMDAVLNLAASGDIVSALTGCVGIAFLLIVIVAMIRGWGLEVGE